MDAEKFADGVLRIVSGGQTGVDRAALDAALAADLQCGGWCPAGRWAEDGPVPERYPLREAPSSDPAVRTRLNVRDSDGTLILCVGMPTGGTALTVVCAEEHGRPVLVLDPLGSNALQAARDWLGRYAIHTLNVAGPRASEAPDLYAAAYRLVASLLGTPGTT